MLQDDDSTRYLEEATPWERLSASPQPAFTNSAQYHEAILHHWFEHQKPYEPVLTFIHANVYYEKLIEYGVEKWLVFPYHLIPELIRYHPSVPFAYYIELFLKVMASDSSYQRIPNFAAADALRVTGVGRNQFIDAMNKFRTPGISLSILKSKEKNLRALLPSAPIRFPLQAWWIAYPVPLSDAKASKIHSAQRAAYRRLITEKVTGIPIGQFPEEEIRGLINDSLVYIEVPLSPQDTVKLLALDKFVMNCVGGDYLEGLCYKSFISIDDRTTVDQLSKMLAVEVFEIAKVLSLFIRLGLAERVTPTEPVDGPGPEPSAKRLALLYDCNLPASLMLGNLGGEIMSHAVTLYEVGKMPDASVMEFATHLKMLELCDTRDESMKSSYEQCQIIARVCFFLRSREISAGGLDMLRLENLLDLDDDSRTKMFERNYSAAVAFSPLTLTRPSLSIPGVFHIGPPSPLFHTPWALVYLHSLARGGPPVFMWPQGDIVTTLPEPFYDYDTARLYRWGAEVQEVSTTTLLISLGDALPTSPVAVQCLEREGEVRAAVGFPSADALIAELCAPLALDSFFGWVETVRGEDGRVFPIDITYGVPTASLALCQHALDAIEAGDMLAAGRKERVAEEAARISGALEAFVATWSAGTGHPARALAAVDGMVPWC
jgi:hypothetical protein